MQFSGDDDNLVYAAALTFLEKIYRWYDEACVQMTKDERRKTCERLNRRAERDLVTKVRVDIRRRKGARLLMKISHANLVDCVQKEQHEKSLAKLFADTALALQEQWREDGRDILELDDATQGLAAEIRAERDQIKAERERKASNDRRLICEFHRRGYCSPCQFECPHYKNGRCVEI